MFTTHSSTGAPVAPSTAFEADDVRIYKNGDAAQKTTTNGVTMISPFDSVTGLHTVVIDTSNDTGDGGFWVTGAVYTLVFTPDETVDSVAVAKVIGQFGIELYGALRPTTAGRKLDVSSGGEAGLDWANIGSPTTSQTLSGTTVGTATAVTTVNGLAAGVITASSIASDAITDAKVASDVTIASVTGAVGSVTGTIGGLTAAALADFFDTNSGTTYGSAVAGSVVKEIADNASGGGGGPSAATIADAVWDEALSGHTTAGTAGKVLADAESDTGGISAIDSNVTAIKAKTDSLTFTVAGIVDTNIQRVNDVAVTGTGAPGDEWGPA
jgi:hypothetical protein